jgi:antitoxin component YwqK of YwqJK toxin-antitoxin module
MKSSISTLLLVVLLYACNKNPHSYWEKTYHNNGVLKDSFLIFDSSGVKYKNGYHFSFNNKGNIISWKEFRINKKYGKHLFYYPDGEISRFCFYNNDTQVYNSYWLFKNGCIHFLDTFVNGKKFGKTTIIDSTGKLIQKGENYTTGFSCGNCDCR